MATLTETAFYTRKYIKWGAVGLILFLVLRIAFNSFLSYLNVLFPPQVIPDNAFGRLSAISFPQSASPSAQLNYSLRTISGTLSEASNSATVYFMPKNRATLLSLSETQALVERIDFTTSPRQITSTAYRWVDITNPLRTIELDIVSKQFTLNYLFAHDLTLFTERNIPTPKQAQAETLDFLQSLNLPTGDIVVSQPKIQYLKLVGNQLQPATSESQADAVRVDYFRQNYHGMPARTDKPQEGNIAFILSGAGGQKRVLYAKYHYWPIDTRVSGIYKLKTPEQAFTELQNGHAYFASLPNNETRIAITNSYLAYYDGMIPQLFYQPVFVFEGDQGFIAYVPAVAPPWTE